MLMETRKRARTPKTSQRQVFESYFSKPQPEPKKTKFREAVELRVPRGPELLPFASRFQPKADSELLDPALKDTVRKYIDRFQTQLSDDDSDSETCQALLVLGDSGSGKTSSLRYIAKALDLTLLEATTMDIRSSSSLHKQLGEATQTHNVLKTALLFVDDIDIVTEQDKGFYRALYDLMQDSKVPLVMTAARIPEELQGKECVQVYHLRADSQTAVLSRMSYINEVADLQLPASTLFALCQQHRGNMSSIVNTMQLRDLSLMCGLCSEVSCLSVSNSQLLAHSPGANWTASNHEDCFSDWLTFVHNNVETEHSEDFSQVIDLLSVLDQLSARAAVTTCTSLLRRDILSSEQVLKQRISTERLVLQESRRTGNTEFKEVLEAEQTSPYQTRSKSRTSTQALL